jgi:glycosyltransferase involved in cell wall biosynthesis
MIYLPFLLDEDKYSPGPPIFREQWCKEVGGDFFVMISSRIDYSFKGSDIAINAFAQFVKGVPTARLIVTDWGKDKSRMELIFEELGISDKVLIVPPAGKRMLIKRLRSADCLIDQLILGYYGASALEAMSCGLPVIMNLNQAQYDSLIPEGCAPVCQADTEKQVLQQLLKLYYNINYRKVVGTKLREWFLQTHSNKKWGKIYEAILWGVSKKKLPEYDNSPLGVALSIEEIDYHFLELKNAPNFPDYS